VFLTMKIENTVICRLGHRSSEAEGESTLSDGIILTREATSPMGRLITADSLRVHGIDGNSIVQRWLVHHGSTNVGAVCFESERYRGGHRRLLSSTPPATKADVFFLMKISRDDALVSP
jgi:hypothetical protein